jgi:hypothetical protein
MPLAWHNKQSAYPSKPCGILGIFAVVVAAGLDVEVEGGVEVEVGVPD